MISTDYLLDALADPDFTLKVRERHPKDLDSALRIALQLEVWTKDSERLKLESPKTVRKESKKMREVTKSSRTTASATECWNKMLLKELEEKIKKVQELESRNKQRKPIKQSFVQTNLLFNNILTIFLSIHDHFTKTLLSATL